MAVSGMVPIGSFTIAPNMNTRAVRLSKLYAQIIALNPTAGSFSLVIIKSFSFLSLSALKDSSHGKY
jgi:hypothetical protein